MFKIVIFIDIFGYFPSTRGSRAGILLFLTLAPGGFNRLGIELIFPNSGAKLIPWCQTLQVRLSGLKFIKVQISSRQARAITGLTEPASG